MLRACSRAGVGQRCSEGEGPLLLSQVLTEHAYGEFPHDFVSTCDFFMRMKVVSCHYHFKRVLKTFKCHLATFQTVLVGNIFIL